MTRTRTSTTPALGSAESTARERNLSGHIFSVSAGLVGVCLTVIGVFNIVNLPGAHLRKADDLIALDAAVLLLACIFSYLALRTQRERRGQQLGRVADVLFLLGLSGVVVIGGVIAFQSR